MTYASHQRRAIVTELLEVAELRPDRTVPTALVQFRAEELGVGVSTMFRWVAEERDDSESPRSEPGHVQFNDSHIEMIMACHGNLTKAKEKLDAQDPDIAAMSDTTFRRRWHEQPAGIRAMAKEGAAAALSQQLRLVYSTSERNAIWHLDHQELPIWVIPAGSKTPMKPWLTTVVDDCTRRIMSTLFTIERPNTESLLVAVAEGIRIRRDNGLKVGGVPVELHSDNGGEFRSDAYRMTLASLNINRTRTMPYYKHQNGKVERVQETMQQDLIADLPGYAEGARTLSNHDLFGLDGPLLPEETLIAFLAEWVDQYNGEHPHSALGGLTPNQKWATFQNPLTAPDPEALRKAMMVTAKNRKVQPSGVFFDNNYYTAPSLTAHIGRYVSVRYFPSEPRYIEVFDRDGDTWVTTAFRQESLTDEQREAIVTESRQSYLQARDYQQRGVERRRAAAMADPALAGKLVKDHVKPDTEQSLLGDLDDYLELFEGESGDGSS